MRPTLALLAGLAGWPFVVAAAGFAMADNRPGSAVTLICAGACALIAVWVSIQTFRSVQAGPARLTIALLGFLLAAAVGATALVFALSFHW
jgi:multisubunit Na+/H+ antiporter MnhB subunit